MNKDNAKPKQLDSAIIAAWIIRERYKTGPDRITDSEFYVLLIDVIDYLSAQYTPILEEKRIQFVEEFINERVI